MKKYYLDTRQNCVSKELHFNSKQCTVIRHSNVVQISLKDVSHIIELQSQLDSTHARARAHAVELGYDVIK